MTNDKNLTPELLEKAKLAPSAAVLLTLAQESGITLTAEQAETLYVQLHAEAGALPDEELDNVSSGIAPECKYFWCKHCGQSLFTHRIASMGELHKHYAAWFCNSCGRPM